MYPSTYVCVSGTPEGVLKNVLEEVSCLVRDDINRDKCTSVRGDPYLKRSHGIST